MQQCVQKTSVQNEAMTVRPRTLKKNIITAFVVVILMLSLMLAILGSHVIKKNILERAQSSVENNLYAAATIYESEIEQIEIGFALADDETDIVLLKNKLGLDYIQKVAAHDIGDVPSEVARHAFVEKKGVGATRVLDKFEMMLYGYGLYVQKQLPIIWTPKAHPTERRVLDEMMSIEYAKPIITDAGAVTSVLVGGKILNQDAEFVDKIRDMIFEDNEYKGRPVGTVTIFLDDVRIATNVLNEDGTRALGTLISDAVYTNVVEKGQKWIDRAFVVTNWYLTGYQPIRDINDNIIGVLYVGLIEEPFVDLMRNTLFIVLGIIVLTATIAFVITAILAETISRPLRSMLDATCQIYGGDYAYKVQTSSAIKELNALATSFNAMAVKLHERECSLKVSNEKLAELNKSYLDLIGFVAHELKGVLSSTILNAYAVRDGFLGMINFKQRKAMDSVTRNLDYLTNMVRNYLDLSRIEKGELAANKRACYLSEDIVADSIEAFAKRAEEKHVEIKNAVAAQEEVYVDVDLLKIVINNLVGNALKYGIDRGKIEISAQRENNTIVVRVYNDGVPLTDEEREQLFQKFSRLDNKQSRLAQGTGLGLFITREIIEKHQGEIWVESAEGGNAFCFRLPVMQ